MTTVYIGSQRLSLDPTRLIGKGGEAYIYNVNGLAAKIFKLPDDPDFAGLPIEQQAAADRIEIHQHKLREFPFHSLPDRVVKPIDLITNKSGTQILGYAMELLKGVQVLLRFAEKSYRQAGVPNDTVMTIFKDLHKTVEEIHKAQVIIGDFNNLNVLVDRQNLARIVDADSMQFGKFICRLYTAQFVDPQKCDPNGNSLVLIKPHDILSDWFAYTAMLMESLLFVKPYGGIYKPKNSAKRIAHDARPMKSISVFNPEVVYPKPAVPYKVLPDDLLDLFFRMFEKNWRGEFPSSLLDFKWTTCSSCGMQHARSRCPTCATIAPLMAKPITQIRGNVTATYVFRTNGLILYATYQGGKLLYLYNEDNKYFREGGELVLTGPPDPLMRYRIQSNKTIMAKSGLMVTLENGVAADRTVVDSFGPLPIMNANAEHRYWVSGGQLRRDGNLGPEEIGSVLENQTLFWVGSSFGFGFYRAGNLTIAFVFDKDRRGINDSVKIDPIRGQFVDSTCVFTKDRCWFMVTSREGTKTINHCSVIRSDGTIEAKADSVEGDGSWLGKIRGKLAVGNFLLSPTDDGIVRVEPQNGLIVLTREFLDTESYVDAESFLLPGPDGIYIVKGKEIISLKII